MELNTAEKLLLLFFEAQAVDHAGRLHGFAMSPIDHAIAKRFNRTGFVLFGRIPLKERKTQPGEITPRSHWCILSAAAWETAEQLHRDRAGQNLEANPFRPRRDQAETLLEAQPYRRIGHEKIPNQILIIR